MTVLTSRFTAALDYVTIVHAGQERKGTNIPYVAHLLAVASLVLENGGDEDQAIAALLHDAVEDQGGEPRLADIRARFGDRIAGMVRGCTDSVSADAGAKGPWRERKRAYLEHLRGACAGDGTMLVSCADKLHNARSILQDFRAVGEEVWERFTDNGEKSAEEILGLYDALAETFAEKSPSSLADELRVTVRQLVTESAKQPDRKWERRG